MNIISYRSHRRSAAPRKVLLPTSSRQGPQPTSTGTVSRPLFRRAWPHFDKVQQGAGRRGRVTTRNGHCCLTDAHLNGPVATCLVPQPCGTARHGQGHGAWSHMRSSATLPVGAMWSLRCAHMLTVQRHTYWIVALMKGTHCG